MLIQDLLKDYPMATGALFFGALLLLSWMLSKWLNDRRVWFILLITCLFLVFMIPPEQKLRKGIDLKGGTILIYQVDTTRTSSSFQMDQMISALSKRINPDGTKDVTIRPMGGDRVEIILPVTDSQEVQSIQDLITQMGQLEFRILANEKHDASAIRQAREMLRTKESVTAPRGYEWVQIGEDHGSFSPESDAVQDGYVLTKIPDETMTVTGDELSKADPTQDRQLQPAVGFQFNTIGASKFGRLTRKFQPDPDGFQYKLAIILDRKVMSAPVILEPMTSGSGQITGGRGGFSADKVNSLVAILNAGKLPAMLIPTPISKDMVGATLGKDTIRKGTSAILGAMIAVPVFMIFYYRFSGLVATLALIVNLIFILGFMGFTQSTFTLPGLAGLALTVGMAVDANVLISERMREERERGSSLNQAIRNGFDRAWYAIIDSNLTTIITGVILYWLGSDQVKGFALTLIFGLVANLFTAVFVSRVIFEVWAKRGWLTELKMMHLIKPPTIDWVSPRFYFVTASIIVNIIAIVVTGLRGSSLLDIDFTGGAAISLRITKAAADEHGAKLVDFVRNKALEVLPNVKVEELMSDQQGTEQSGPLLLVRTTESNQMVIDPGGSSLTVGQLLSPEEIQKVIRSLPEGAARPKTRLAAKAVLIEEFRDKLNILETVRIDDWKLEKTDQPAESSETDGKINEPKAQDATKPSSEAKNRVRLTLNQAVSLDAFTEKVDLVLSAAGLAQPQLYRTIRFADEGSGQTAKVFILETDQNVNSLMPKLNEYIEKDPIFDRENNFGSQVAGETRNKAILATVLSWFAMIAYLWFRFKKASYGLAAVVSLIHDVLVALGFIAVGGWLAEKIPGLAGLFLIDDFKIDLTVVSAFMTIIGYSVNDTIVVFDRLREIKGKSPVVTAEIINASVNQCMSRTILTSFTVMLVCIVMYIFGGPGVHAFSFAMLIGAFSGCYSTVFIAAPTLFLFEGPKQASTTMQGVRLQGATARA